MKIIREFDEWNPEDFEGNDIKGLNKDLEGMGFEKFKGVLIMHIDRNGKTEAGLISGRGQKEINEVFREVYSGHSFKGEPKTIIGIGTHLAEMQKKGSIIFWDVIDGFEMRPEFKSPVYKPFDYIDPYYFAEVLEHYTTNGKSIIVNVFGGNNRQTKYHQEFKDGRLTSI
jgi:hypothetical protein